MMQNLYGAKIGPSGHILDIVQCTINEKKLPPISDSANSLYFVMGSREIEEDDIPGDCGFHQGYSNPQFR